MLAYRFAVSLQTAEPPAPKSDVALLVSPSFEEKSVVANTFYSETWGAAQKSDKKFPFSKGKKFAMKIVAESHNYKVGLIQHMPVNNI